MLPIIDAKNCPTRLESLELGLRYSLIEMTRLASFLENSSVKHIRFIGGGSGRQYFGDQIETVLQLLVPESPKTIELNQRLSKEITQKQRENLYSWQIEDLKTRIENEIELKYNTFDANELSKVNDDNDDSNIEYKKYTYKWTSKIETIKFDFNGNFSKGFLRLAKRMITPQRVRMAYKNLKGLSIGWKRCNVIDYICGLILNNLGFQLESLHLRLNDDSGTRLEKINWQFTANNYPCTKDAISSSWFPRNVRHLCLGSEMANMFDVIHFAMMPKLKHLSIAFDMEIERAEIEHYININQIRNLNSFICNGLQSLHFGFINVGVHRLTDWYKSLDKIESIFKENDNSNVKLANNFILKIDTEIDCIDEPPCANVKAQRLFVKLNSLRSLLFRQLSSVMFGFRIDAHKCPFSDDVIKILKDLTANGDETKVVHANVAHDLFAIVWKSKTASNEKFTCDSCHIEPIHEFDCEWCEAHPWLD